MDTGWIKLHRNILKWEWYTDVNTYKLFTHFLLLANHKERKWKGQIVKEGQFITGRHALSRDTGLTEQQIRTCIKRLKSTNELTIKSTNEFSLITVVKWEDYQGKPDKSTNDSTNKSTNEQPAINHKQELKNIKNDTHATEVANEPFNSEAYFTQMLDSEVVSEKIMACFVLRKGVWENIKNKEGVNALFKKYNKVAKRLVNYEESKVVDMMDRCAKMTIRGEKVNWTLFTVEGELLK